MNNSGLIILFGMAAFFGFSLVGGFTDLILWASWCLINAVMALIAVVLSVEDKSRLVPTEQQCFRAISILFMLFVAVVIIMVVLRKTILPV